MAFTEYEWQGLIFTYKTSSSDLVTSTNPSLGTVLMATDYNAVESPFTDKRTMQNFEFTNSAKPSLSFSHMIETKRSETVQSKLYTRDGPPPTGADIRLYDIGTFAIATQGMQSTDAEATIGELWVSYQVKFSKPRFDIDAGIEDDVFTFSGTTITTAEPIGTAGGAANVERLPTSGDLGCVLVKGTDGTGEFSIVFPKDSSGKCFQVQYLMYGTTGSVAASAVIVNDNLILATQTTPTASLGSPLRQTSLVGTQFITYNSWFKIGNIPNDATRPVISLATSTLVANDFPTGTRNGVIIVTEINRNMLV